MKRGETKTCSWKQDWWRNDAHCCLGTEREYDILEEGKRIKTTWIQAENLFLSNAVTTVAEKKISINNKELLSHATLIWLAWHFHYMLMNYGWWERLSPSECNWTFISYLNARLSEILKEVVAILEMKVNKLEILN